MAEIALVNLDKCEIVDPTESGHGYKMKEAIANWMPTDILWLFTVPADGKLAPPPSTLRKREQESWATGSTVATARVPVGHWAGDRIIIFDEYVGTAEQNLPADLLAKFPNADPTVDVLGYVQEHLKHIDLADYKPAEALDATDALFPTDRVWVVRNLTKLWYARADVVVNKTKSRGPAVLDGLGLSDVIWAHIGGALSGGDGYGDRFDIQTLSAIDNSTEGKAWTDESNKAKHTLSEFHMNDVSDVRDDDYDYDY
ncbi:hypothetical protein B0H12DRAFT_1332145 [Mycena haematopus]|nr:hypothetical protein B0H12DRAFT_1332145 [Mycena haematopus]